MEAMAGSLATVLICDDEPSLRELIRISLDGPYRSQRPTTARSRWRSPVACVRT